MIDPKKLEEWKRLADATPPAPWRVVGVAFHPEEDHEPPPPDLFTMQGESGKRADEVFAFIAAAREAVPALISEVEALRAVLRDVEWRGSIGAHEGMGEAYCPICGRDAEHDPDHPREHAPGCRLAALLTPAPAATLGG